MAMLADEGWGCGPSSNENKKCALLYLSLFYDLRRDCESNNSQKFYLLNFDLCWI